LPQRSNHFTVDDFNNDTTHKTRLYYASSSYFPLADANGNAVTYLDDAGNVQAHYTYNAFGGTVSPSGDMDDDFRFRFSSKYLDDETGFYYYGYRYYCPTVGRWLNRDPIEEDGGVMLYGVVGNGPVDKWDYLGRATMPWGWSCCPESGKIFYPDSQCCVKEKVVTFKGDGDDILTWEWVESEEEVVKNKAPVETGVIKYKYRAGGGPMHWWIKWPGGTVDVNGGAVIDPHLEDRKVIKPASIPSNSSKNNTTPDPVRLSPCEYDVDKFSKCISSKISLMIGSDNPYDGLCDGFVNGLVDDCKKESKRQ